jgi:hypothetical protein
MIGLPGQVEQACGVPCLGSVGGYTGRALLDAELGLGEWRDRRTGQDKEDLDNLADPFCRRCHVQVPARAAKKGRHSTETPESHLTPLGKSRGIGA